MSRIFEVLGRFNPFNNNKGLLFLILKRKANRRQNRKVRPDVLFFQKAEDFPSFLFSSFS